MDEDSPFLTNSSRIGATTPRSNNSHLDMSSFNNQHNNGALLGGAQPRDRLRYRRSSFTPLFDRDDSGIYEGATEKYINDPIHVSQTFCLELRRFATFFSFFSGQPPCESATKL
jgi:hypothetical protein